MKAWQLLSSRKTFCKARYAKDRNGLGVPPKHSSACAWCLVGAIQKCYPPSKSSGKASKARMALVLIGISLEGWSDTHGWRAVHRLLKKLNI